MNQEQRDKLNKAHSLITEVASEIGATSLYKIAEQLGEEHARLDS